MSKKLIADNVFHIIHYQHNLMASIGRLRNRGLYTDPALSMFSMLWQVLGPEFSVEQVKMVQKEVKNFIPLKICYFFFYPVHSIIQAPSSRGIMENIFLFLGVNPLDLVEILLALHYNSRFIYYMLLAKSKSENKVVPIPYDNFFKQARSIFQFKWLSIPEPTVKAIEESYSKLYSDHFSERNDFSWALDNSGRAHSYPFSLLINKVQKDIASMQDTVKHPELMRAKRIRYLIMHRYIPLLLIIAGFVLPAVGLVWINVAPDNDGSATSYPAGSAGDNSTALDPDVKFILNSLMGSLGFAAICVALSSCVCNCFCNLQCSSSSRWHQLLIEGVLLERNKGQAEVNVPGSHIELSNLEAGLLHKGRDVAPKAVTDAAQDVLGDSIQGEGGDYFSVLS